MNNQKNDSDLPGRWNRTLVFVKIYVFKSMILLAALVAASAVLAADEDLDAYAPGAMSNCVIEPNDVIELSSRIDGILEEVNAERGDWVEAGGVLAKLEAGVEQAAVEHARARADITSEILSNEASLKYGELTLNRITELGEKRVVSADEIDRVASETEIAAHRLQQAHDNKRIAELELERTKQVLKRHTIRSPINGVIADRYLSAGESVEEKPIFRIAQLDPLRVELVVPSSEFGLIEDGDAATVHIQGLNGGAYDANVIIVDPLIDPASGTFRVTLELPNPEKRLTSGLRCDVTFLDANEAVAASLEDDDAQPDPVDTDYLLP